MAVEIPGFMADIASELVGNEVVIVDGRVINFERIRRIEKMMLKGMARRPIQIEHHFCDGIYARSTLFPVGCFFSGRIHKSERIAILVKGEVSMWTKDDGLQRIKAPFVMVSRPLTRLAVYVHVESIMVCVCATTERDVTKLDGELFADIAEFERSAE